MRKAKDAGTKKKRLPTKVRLLMVQTFIYSMQ
jgi:hypothetical protein